MILIKPKCTNFKTTHQKQSPYRPFYSTRRWVNFGLTFPSYQLHQIKKVRRIFKETGLKVIEYGAIDTP